MKLKIQIVLFDAAGVLFPANKVGGEELSVRFNLSEAQLKPMYDGLYKDFSKGKLTTENFLDTFAQMYGIDRSLVTDEAFTSRFKQALRPMEDMDKLLQKLKSAGLRLALLSDTSPLFTTAREDGGYYKHFEKLFLSYDIGFLKPDPGAYKTVVDYFAVPPEVIFFVDDRPGNVEAALAEGMRGTTFTSARKLEATLQVEGVL